MEVSSERWIKYKKNQMYMSCSLTRENTNLWRWLIPVRIWSTQVIPKF